MATKSFTIETAAGAVPAAPAVGQLSFTGRRADEGVNLWSPAEVTGDWGEQCRVGRGYGREAVNYIRETFGGVEVGFFAALSMILAASA